MSTGSVGRKIIIDNEALPLEAKQVTVLAMKYGTYPYPERPGPLLLRLQAEGLHVFLETACPGEVRVHGQAAPLPQESWAQKRASTKAARM